MNILLWSFIFLHLLINIFTAGCTGKSFSEELILASTNPQYDKRLFIEVQYMKILCSEHAVYINCSESQNKNKKQFVYTICSELAILGVAISFHSIPFHFSFLQN